MPDAEFVVFGEGPLREMLEGAASELGVRPHVRFPGFTRDLPRWILASDVVVSTSVFEGSPNVVMEAMACRTPLVLSDIPSLRALVGAGALYFREGDAEGLSSCISSTLSDVAGTAARVDVAAVLAEGFSVGVMVTRYEEVYDGLLRHRREPQPGGPT